PHGRKTTCAVTPTSPTPSPGCRPIRRPGPTSCTRRACAVSRTSARWSARWTGRSTCSPWTTPRPWPNWPRPGWPGSRSAARPLPPRGGRGGPPPRSGASRDGTGAGRAVRPAPPPPAVHSADLRHHVRGDQRQVVEIVQVEHLQVHAFGANLGELGELGRHL